MNRAEWFNEAKAGLFIHWGLYSSAAGEWKGEAGHRDAHLQHEFRIPITEYAKLADSFNPVEFDADSILKLAHDGGLGYIVYVAKHHDGFAMFDSPSDPYNIVKTTPFKRDPLLELAEACSKTDIKLCIYYSLGRDWHVSGVPYGGWRCNDWDFPDARSTDIDDYMEGKVKPQLRELLTQYGPVGVIWFDTPDKVIPAHSQDLYKFIKSIQPDCLVNSRVGNGMGDYDTHEQHIPSEKITRPWEACLTLNDHWGYTPNDHNWKSAAMLVRCLVDVASKGGNFLINIGPSGTGRVPEESVTRLRELGDWLALHGESIYGTTLSPCDEKANGGIVFAEVNMDGSEKMTADASAPHESALPSGWRATGKPGFIYIHLFDRPDENRFLLPSLPGKLKRATLLTDPNRQELRVTNDKDGLLCQLPQEIWDNRVTVVRLEIG